VKATWIILILFSSFCFADSDWRNEVTIYSGVSFLNAEHEGDFCLPCVIPVDHVGPFDFISRESVDTSLLIGFKYGHYFNENIEVEGNFSIAPSRNIETETGFFCDPGVVCPLSDFAPILFRKENAVTYYYDGNFVYNFPTGKITPFISAGMGGISTEREFAGTQHDLALTFGGGAKFTFEHVGFRIEVNDRVIPEYFLTHDLENDLQIQYGVMIGF
jgi:Outer membrane protein beta-barrel domain